MWNDEKGDECSKCMDALEEASAKHTGAVDVRKLLEELTAEERKHVEGCEVCREGAEEIVAARELFQGVASFAGEERPWFAARVMAAIASRERELALRLSAWSEFARYGARLTWATALLLLVGTTLFYEKVVRAPSYQPNGTSQESLFEGPQQASQDDILISMAGSNP